MSVRSREREDYGRVVAHSNYIIMKNCRFIVNQRGRLKVLKEKKKNVHAFVRGETTVVWGPNDKFVESLEPPVDRWQEVAYNPYRFSTFVCGERNTPVGGAEEVLILNNKVYAKRIWCI